MDIPVGRIIWSDLGSFLGGLTLYLVVRPPIYCSVCGEINAQWHEVDGILTCLVCEKTIINPQYVPCDCGDIDLMGLRVVQNNDWGLDVVDDQMHDFNNHLGRHMTICKKRLEKDLKKNSHTIRLLSHEDSVNKKRLLTWTSQIEYDPSKPMPEWIKEMWPI